MNKKNIDRIRTVFDRVLYTMVIIALLICTAVTAWSGNMYNKMRQAVETDIDLTEETIRVVEINSEIYKEMIRVTEENSGIYKELMQSLVYPEED